MNESSLCINISVLDVLLKIVKLSSYRMDVFKKELKTLRNLSSYRMDVFKKGLKSLRNLSSYRMDVFKKGSKCKKKNLIIYIVVFDNGIE